MKNNHDRLMGLLGLARKSGRLTAGFDAVKDLVCREKDVLVLFAADLSPKTEKELRYAAGELKNAIHLKAGKDEIARVIGSKKPVGVIAIEDKGFAEAVSKVCSDLEGELKEEGS